MNYYLNTKTSLIRSLLLLICITSAKAAEPDWAWVGSVTPTSAVLRAGWSEGTPGEMWVQISGQPQNRMSVQPQVKEAGDHGKVATYAITPLRPDESFEYGWGNEVGGTFRSFPEGQADFTFAFSSCARTRSNHEVFDEIRRQEPLFFLHMGDMHYRDIRQNDVNRFRAGLRGVMDSPRQNRMFRSFPVIYMWDDHDFGPNDSHRNSPSREAAMAWYRQEVPHFPLAAGDDPDASVYQAFTVGRVRIILSDLRSSRDPHKVKDDKNKTMMGAQQLAWFKQELLDSHRTHALIIWMAGVPWTAHENPSDSWIRYTHERRVISDFMVKNKITNICAVAGDAHMLGYDDGRNNTFASDGKGPGFPVFQAAALDHRGSVKGGPYSGGTRPNSGRMGEDGQFGILRIKDRGQSIEVTFEGRNHKGEKLMEHTFRRPL